MTTNQYTWIKFTAASHSVNIEYLDSNQQGAGLWTPDEIDYGTSSRFHLKKYTAGSSSSGWNFYGITFWGEGGEAFKKSNVAQNFLSGTTNGSARFKTTSGGVHHYVQTVSVSDDEISFKALNEGDSHGGTISFQVTIVRQNEEPLKYYTSRDPEIPLRRNDG